MMKKALILLALLILSSASYAADNFTSISVMPSAGTSTLTSRFSNGIGIGIINANGSSAAVATWRPDIHFNGLGLGLDVNIPLGDNKPTNIDTVVLRYAEYNTPGWGLNYGVLNNMTLGYGLLVNNYSTSAQGGIMQTNRQTGLKGYFRKDTYGLDYFGTWSNVYAGRISEQISNNITLGEYYIADTDGVNYTTTGGTTVKYPPVSGLGIDAGMPIFYGATLFSEFAHLNNHGSGFSAGVDMKYDILVGSVAFRAERRFIDSNFVPGYFNEYYETNPIDIVSYEATSTKKDGYKVQFGASVLNKGWATAVLEGYNGSNSALTAKASAQLTDDYFAEAAIYQPNFVDSRSLDVQQGAVITGKLGYKVNPNTMVVANYKKAYDNTLGKVVETQWYEVSLSF